MASTTYLQRPGLLRLGLCLYLVSLYLLVKVAVDWTPTPKPKDAPESEFSEARSRVHLDVLASHGDRQVSMPGLVTATAYMEQQINGLQQLAEELRRNDLKAEAVKQVVGEGAVGMTFTRINFTNAYRKLDNLALILTPKGTEGKKAVLVASHFDGAVCSQGAADDLSQVSVMLEVARAIIHAKTLPLTPIIFLWTGGEEPISPAAHGWVSGSEHHQKVGAFVNLEAMGGGGLPIIFQHTGAWALDAYQRGAPHVRGSRVAQDIFDLHIIPADSDFRMFSARHYGSLPGMDIAFIVDSTAYHSYLDGPERVRQGVMQEMGDGLLGGVLSLSEELARRQQAAAERIAGGQTAAAESDLERTDALERAVYWDVLGLVMVVYPDHLADVLHNLPLALVLLAPLASYLLGAGPAPSSKASKGPQGTSKLAAKAAPQSESLMTLYARMLGAAGRTLCSIVLAVGLTAGLGAARAVISGKPMIWFAQHWVGGLIYLPISAAGALLPWLSVSETAETAAPGRHGDFLSTQLWGCGLTSSIISSALTAVGLRGNAFIFAQCGALALVMAPLVSGPRLRSWALALGLAVAVVPVIVGTSAVHVFVAVIMERMALSGHVGVALADIVVGVLFGAGVLAASAGVLLPLIAYSLAGVRRPVIGLLITTSLLAAIGSSLYMSTYTPTAPKRAIISHIHHTAPVTAGAEGTTGAERTMPDGPPGGGVAMQVVHESMSLGIVDSTPLESVFNLSGYTLAKPWGRENTPIYPLDGLIKGATFSVPASWKEPVHSCGSHARHAFDNATEGLPVTFAPFVQLLSSEEGGGSGGATRLHMRLYSQLPCWGILNITGPIRAWSFTPQLHPSFISGDAGPKQNILRFVTQDPDPYWTFWVDVPAGSTADGASSFGVHAELSISYLYRTPVLTHMVRALPDLMTETWLATVFQSEWDF